MLSYLKQCNICHISQGILSITWRLAGTGLRFDPILINGAWVIRSIGIGASTSTSALLTTSSLFKSTSSLLSLSESVLEQIWLPHKYFLFEGFVKAIFVS